MTLTSKGLFLLDLNDLVRPEDDASPNFKPAETHATVCVQPEPLPAEADTRVPRKETVVVADVDDRDSHVDDEVENKHEVSSEDNSQHEIGCQPHSEAELPMPVCMPLDNRVHSTHTSSCIDRSKSVPRSFQVIPRGDHGPRCPSDCRRSKRDPPRPRSTSASTPWNNWRTPRYSLEKLMWARPITTCGVTSKAGCCGSHSTITAVPSGNTAGSFTMWTRRSSGANGQAHECQ